MAFHLTFSRLPLRIVTSAAILALMAGTPAIAQKTVEGRVERLEKEMQAVQRKVFPGGAGQVISPDLQPTQAAPEQAGAPASTPLADLIGRVNAIEGQQTRLTGQIEQDGFRIRQLEEANKLLTTELADLRKQIAALATPPAPAEVAVEVPVPSRLPTASGTAKPAAQPAVKADPAGQARAQAVAAIAKPAGNNAQDSYTYGFRLWDAKFYPEAQAQLQATLDKFPNDPVASRAANLLGRAYLDDNNPNQAARILYENYRSRPNGDRAAESLAWAGEALIRLKRPKDACLFYEELADSFGQAMTPNVRDMMEKGRKTAKCGA